MNFLKPTLLTLLFTSLLSCENDVDINAEYTEVTSVIGLIDVRTDTQFIKITKTFLDDEQNALQLAGDPDRIYYDSLNVKLVSPSTGDEIQLNKILVAKDQGIFTQERNEIYYTAEKLITNTPYELIIKRPGSDVVTKGATTPTNGAILTRPRPSVAGKINIINFQDGIEDPRFEFQTSTNIGEFNVLMRFNYVEVTNNVDSVEKSFDIPFSTFRNVSLESGKEFIYILEGQRFFNLFTSLISVVPDDKRAIYRFMPEKNASVIIESADGEYALYRDVNGPIDGLSQTRPEFTNITNGIGLFASRTSRTWNLDFSNTTRNFIHSRYGKTSGGAPDNLAEFRGFYPL